MKTYKSITGSLAERIAGDGASANTLRRGHPLLGERASLPSVVLLTEDGGEGDRGLRQPEPPPRRDNRDHQPKGHGESLMIFPSMILPYLCVLCGLLRLNRFGIHDTSY
jgi:hypothetical protein